MSASSDDIHAIRAIIERQFASLNWTPTERANWPAFAEDFHPQAALYPAARPVAPASVPSFIARMQGLAATTLPTFKERMLGANIRIFGNVAVAMAACELTENGENISRGVEAMLLVKDAGRWQIVSQGWDMEKPDNTIPPAFLSG